MKIKFVFFFISLLFLFFRVYSQETQNVLKYNYLGVMLGSYNLAYERVLDNESSLQLSLGYRNYSFPYNVSKDTTFKYDGFTAVAEYRWYLKPIKRVAPAGLYIAPFVRYGYYHEGLKFAKTPEYDYTYRITSWSGGLMGGYQAVIAKMVVFDFFVGLQYKSKNAKIVFKNPSAYNVTPANYSKKFGSQIDNTILDYFRIGVNVGITF